MGNDTLTGNAGDDTLEGGRGNDALIGGSGDDTVDLSKSSSDTTIDLAAGTSAGGQMGSDTLNSIENAVLGSGDDTITGSAADNILDGGAGDDVLDGAAGDDTLLGGTGDDQFKVSDGDDTVVAGGGTDTLIVSAGYQLEGLLLDPTSGDLTLSLTKNGNHHSVTITAQDIDPVTTLRVYSDSDTSVDYSLLVSLDAETGVYAADTDLPTRLTGTVGDDELIGGAGNDIMLGNSGDDILDGAGAAIRLKAVQVMMFIEPPMARMLLQQVVARILWRSSRDTLLRVPCLMPVTEA